MRYRKEDWGASSLPAKPLLLGEMVSQNIPSFPGSRRTIDLNDSKRRLSLFSSSCVHHRHASDIS